MEVGVSTACLYPMNTEEALDIVISLDVHCTEIFFNSPSELEVPFLRMLRSKIKESDVRVCSIHPFTSAIEPFMFFSDYERRFYDMLEFYKRYFEAAQLLQCNILVIHGDKLPVRINEQLYFERFLKLVELGAEYGVRVAQENVNMHRSQNIAFIKRFKEALEKYAYFVFDIKQAVRAGEDPICMLQEMGDRLIHVHVNDNTSEQDCLLPGKGNMNYRQVLDIIRDFHISPDWVIEVYRNNYNTCSEMKDSINFLRKSLKIL